MIHSPNKANAYRQVATQTASPGQLILMLFDGAINFLERAQQGFAYDDPLAFNQTIHVNVQRAQAIIHELNSSLNMEAGGQLSTTLRRLYDYFDRRLEQSNRLKQPHGIREVIRWLKILRTAWAEMLQKQTPAAANG